MYDRKSKKYRISPNRAKKTYTIRIYEHNKQIGKYRSYPQGKNFTDQWTQEDIIAFLSQPGNCYAVA